METKARGTDRNLLGLKVSRHADSAFLPSQDAHLAVVTPACPSLSQHSPGVGPLCPALSTAPEPWAQGGQGALALLLTCSVAADKTLPPQPVWLCA